MGVETKKPGLKGLLWQIWILIILLIVSASKLSSSLPLSQLRVSWLIRSATRWNSLEAPCLELGKNFGYEGIQGSSKILVFHPFPILLQGPFLITSLHSNMLWDDHEAAFGEGMAMKFPFLTYFFFKTWTQRLLWIKKEFSSYYLQFDSLTLTCALSK